MLYRFQVQAFNLEGDGEWSSPSYALHTPAVPETPVDAPDVTGKSHNSIRLRWDAPKTRGSVGCPNIALKNLRDGVCTTAGPGTAVTGYRIYVSYGVNGDEGPQGGPITRSGGEFDVGGLTIRAPANAVGPGGHYHSQVARAPHGLHRRQRHGP